MRPVLQVEQIASEENSTDGNPYIRGIEAFNLNVQHMQRLGTASQVRQPRLAYSASPCTAQMQHHSSQPLASAAPCWSAPSTAHSLQPGIPDQLHNPAQNCSPAWD